MLLIYLIQITLQTLSNNKYKPHKLVALHYVLGQQYRNQNPNLPSLDPWVLAVLGKLRELLVALEAQLHELEAELVQLARPGIAGSR